MKLTTSREKETFTWISKFIDEVTEIEPVGDKMYLRVNGEIVGIISYQRLVKRDWK